jgi:DNA-binding YbaB/EbfC family protein
MDLNPLDLLKSAKKLQEEMGSINKKMEDILVTGSAGAGMVEVDMDGRIDVVAVRIVPEVVNPSDIEMLQDLILCAFNDACKKTKLAISKEMGGIVGNLDMSKLKDMVS